MRWVYNSGSEKPPPPPTVSTKPASQGGFFSSMFSAFGGGVTPQRTPTPLPVVPAKVVNPRTISDTSVSLTIFAADVDVKLDKKIAAELHRSTKKNPPSKMKYELIYVSGCLCDRAGLMVLYYRRLRRSMMRARRRMSSSPLQRGVYFKGFVLILTGTVGALTGGLYTECLFPGQALRGYSLYLVFHLGQVLVDLHLLKGHATAQTTGVGGHMAARFIPTVERESIDLMYVAS